MMTDRQIEYQKARRLKQMYDLAEKLLAIGEHNREAQKIEAEILDLAWDFNKKYGAFSEYGRRGIDVYITCDEDGWEDGIGIEDETYHYYTQDKA